MFSCCHWLPAISIFDGNYVAGVYPGAGVERRNISSLIVEVEEILSPNGKGLLFTEMQSLSPNTVELLRLRVLGLSRKSFCLEVALLLAESKKAVESCSVSSEREKRLFGG